MDLTVEQRRERPVVVFLLCALSPLGRTFWVRRYGIESTE